MTVSTTYPAGQWNYPIATERNMSTIELVAELVKLRKDFNQLKEEHEVLRIRFDTMAKCVLEPMLAEHICVSTEEEFAKRMSTFREFLGLEEPKHEDLVSAEPHPTGSD